RRTFSSPVLPALVRALAHRQDRRHAGPFHRHEVARGPDCFRAQEIKFRPTARNGHRTRTHVLRTSSSKSFNHPRRGNIASHPLSPGLLKDKKRRRLPPFANHLLANLLLTHGTANCS
ncbi:uncharacterized protein PHACADRAFT_171264, partial [Phanerochaete carnosa HHB-10118-sp]